MSVNKFKRAENQEEASALADKIQKQREKQNKRKREVEFKTSNGNEYLIRKWDAMTAIDKAATASHVLYAPQTAVTVSLFDIDGYIREDASQADFILLFFSRLNEFENASEYYTCFLDGVTHKDTNTALNFETDFDEEESAFELIELVTEVLKVNFIIRLCNTMLAQTRLLLESKDLYQHLSQEKK